MGGNRSSYRAVPRSHHVSVLYSRHIFTSLRAASSFVVSQLFIPCRLNSISNSPRLLFPAEQLLFPTTPAFIFYSLPINFRFQLTPTFIRCRPTSVSNSRQLLFAAEQLLFPTTPAFILCRASRSNRHPNFYFTTNSFRSHSGNASHQRARERH